MKTITLFIFLMVISTISCKKDAGITATTPSALISSPKNIGINTCTVVAIFQSDGGSAITEEGVCYKIGSNPTIADNKVIINGSTGTFSVAMTGLNANTNYTYCAYATNARGTSYSRMCSFTTLVDTLHPIVGPPVVATDSANSLNTNSFVANGYILTNGGLPITQKGFCYSTSATPDTNSNKVVDTMSSSAFNNKIVSLNPNTVYHLRAYAINNKGISYGNEILVTTLSVQIANVVTQPCTNVAGSSFIANGNIVWDGGGKIIEKGFCYSTTPGVDTNSNKMVNTMSGNTFSTTIGSLTSNTAYYVKAYVLNSVGIAYGNEVLVNTGNLTYRPSQIIRSTDTGTTTQTSNFIYDNAGRLIGFNTLNFSYSASSLWPYSSSTTSYTYDSAGNIYKSNDLGQSLSNQYFYTVNTGYIGRAFSMIMGNANMYKSDFISYDHNNNVIMAVANSQYTDMRVQSYSNNSFDTSTYTYTTYKNPLYNLKAVLFLINNGLDRWTFSANLPASESYKYYSYDSNNGGSSSSYTGNYAYTLDQLGRVITSKETCNSGVTVTLTFYY